jgi:hypothetical protein
MEEDFIGEDLTKRVKAIRNHCDTFLLLQQVKNVQSIKRLFPTLLRDIHTDAQIIMDKYCVEK